jgi:predicted Zn-dependent protease
MTDLETRLEDRLLAALPSDVDYASARHVVERGSRLEVRNGVVEPSATAHDEGVMFSIWVNGGAGYAATSDLSDDGLDRAVEQARGWAAATAGRTVIDSPPLLHTVGEYSTPVTSSFDSLSLADQVALLVDADIALGGHDRIVDRSASLVRYNIQSLLLTNGGGRVAQHIRQVFPDLRATANEGSNTQNRTYGAGNYAGQGGVEVLTRHGFRDAATRIADEAVALLDAPNCPTGTMDLILAPDQMVLQIHESIGHPLELDRILGDERNYAGTSFVTQDMFGSYQYGSELLNVTFDPTVPGQMASYAFDDDGTPAKRTHLIQDGILQRPMGGTISQARSGMAGVANSRASSWNRAPIDRMANLNVEPGVSTVDELIGGIENGVLMETNVSWSIDDSRNKFQFGAELGRVIENGEITHIVRNPNYRGISATFWRNLSGVADDFTVMAVGNCGKGEPNQVIRVGHASPHCRFSNVEVFGGES